MTTREIRRIALRNIIDGVTDDIRARPDHWRTHPETGADLSPENARQVELAAKAILSVLERRVARAKDFGGGR